MSEQKMTQRPARSPYVIVFVILAVFTALEVGASYLPEAVKVPVLIILAISKASLIFLYFMHLKSDNRLFAMPILVALLLIIPIVLIMTLVMPHM
jgi:caa(3)-type oxidase subunit IV